MLDYDAWRRRWLHLILVIVAWSELPPAQRHWPLRWTDKHDR
jgi:hypothetical protein